MAIEHAFRAARGTRGVVAGVHPGSKRIGEILEAHDPRWVSSLNDSIRRTTEACLNRFFPAGAIANAGKRSAVVLDLLTAREDAAFALMTVWSGYAREAAVRAVTEVPGPFCLALLIYRLNDWVPQVRAATEEKLASLLDDLADQTIADCYELLFTFARFGRAGSTGRALVHRLLDRPGVDKIIREFLLSSPHDRVLRLFRLRLQNGQFDQELKRLATAARHANVRALATRTLLEGQFRWRDRRGLASRPVSFTGSRSALARIALKDRSPRVRIAAIDYVIGNLGTWADPKEVFATFATHRSLALAERALYGLQAIGMDPLAVLRSRLRGPSGPDRTVAILLGRRGNEEDAASLFEAAQQSDGRSRLTFLAAAARLGHTSAINELKDTALNAVDVNVAKTAAKAIRDSGQRIDSNELVHIADRGQEFFDRGLGTFLPESQRSRA